MKSMCRIICLLLAILLLTACSTPQQPEETKSDAQILAERRDLVEADMRNKMTFLWRAAEDIVYSKNASSAGMEADAQENPDSILHLKAGRVYSGMPYSHGSSSAFSFLTFSKSQDSNGVYEISGITTEMITGGPKDVENNRARVSSDCADSVFWSWGRISSTISFGYCRRMTENYGCLKVGNYESVSDAYEETKDICKQNGEQVMFAAYAQLQKADAVVHYDNGGGHAMMAVEVHTVKNGDIIDPEQSYITVLEQISSNIRGEEHYFDEKLQENVYLCGGVDVKYTFQKLFDTGYLPVTCKELIDPSPLREETVFDKESEHNQDTIFKGVLSSYYRISSVTITITDASGKQVQQLIGLGKEGEMMSFRLPRLLDKAETAILGSIDLTALPAGTYRCTHVCQISTGSKITVRDFQFTV